MHRIASQIPGEISTCFEQKVIIFIFVQGRGAQEHAGDEFVGRDIAVIE